MNTGVQLLLDFLRGAWSALAGALLVFGLLGLLVLVLLAVASSVTGARISLAEVLLSAVSMGALVFLGLVGIPELAEYLISETVNMNTDMVFCEPLAEIGVITARVLAAFGVLRMLLSFTKATALLMIGGRRGVSDALLNTGESVVGILVALLASPAAAHFLGLC